jgi:hypothetical protein
MIERQPEYVNRLGKRIDGDTYRYLMSMPSYRAIRRFKNAKHTVKVDWFGVLPAHIYRMTVGTPELGKEEHTFYPTEQEAINDYEHFLVVHCGCEWFPTPSSPSGVMLLEVGNEATNKITQVKIGEDEILSALETNSQFASW